MPLFQSGQILCVSPNHLAAPFTQSSPGIPQPAPAEQTHRYQLQAQLSPARDETDGQHTWRALDLDAPPGDRATTVILKLMAFGDGVGWQRLKLFEREMQVVQSLDHPQLPHYRSRFSVEVEGSTWWGFAQDYIEGESLKALLASGHDFSEAQLSSIATQVLRILDYLHHRQPTVLHRDVKPSNLLFNSKEEIFLVDLGAAQIRPTAIGESFTVVGTYGYAPMEQFGGRAVPASDLYALGSTLIHLLTGIAPADAPFPPTSWPAISPAFKTWLQVMIQPDPQERYGSAAEALEALTASSRPLGHNPLGQHPFVSPPSALQAIQTVDSRHTTDEPHTTPRIAAQRLPAHNPVSPRNPTTPLIARSYPSPRNPRIPSTPPALSPHTPSSGPLAHSPLAHSIRPQGLGGQPTRLQRSPIVTAQSQGIDNPTLAPVKRPSGSQVHIERSTHHLRIELPGNDLGNVLAGFGGIFLMVSWLVSPLFVPLALVMIILGLWHSAPHQLRLERHPSGSSSDADSSLSLQLILWRTVFGKTLRRRQERQTRITHLRHTLRTHDQRPDFHQPSRAFIIQTPRQEYRLNTTLSPAESTWLMQELHQWLNTP